MLLFHPILNFSFLSPLVEELKTAWYNGVEVFSPQGLPLIIRLALSCIACDIPATRKACGFLGHNAAHGYNKCMKKFSVSFGNPTNYSACNRDGWPLRTDLSLPITSRHTLEVQRLQLALKGNLSFGLAYINQLNRPSSVLNLSSCWAFASSLQEYQPASLLLGCSCGSSAHAHISPRRFLLMQLARLHRSTLQYYCSNGPFKCPSIGTETR